MSLSGGSVPTNRPSIEVWRKAFAQTNREGWKRAVKRGGVYDLTALAEVNEGERASSVVMSIYVDENMKAAKEAKVQLHKVRFGPGIADPVSVFVDGDAYIFGEEVAGFGAMPSSDDFDALFSDSTI